jgi:quinolinate synthase
MGIRPEALLSRFPEYSERIQKRIEQDEDFKCLCSDYEKCMEMLKSLTVEPEKVKSSLEEYLEIKIELEQEVLKYLFD